MKVYLAHPITDYGGSERQCRAIAAIEERGWTVVSPDNPLHQVCYQRHGMAHFIELVEDCDGLAFMRFPSGKIGAGVEKEIAAAFRVGIPIYDVDNGLSLTHMMPIEVMSVDETRAEIAALRKSKAMEAT